MELLEGELESMVNTILTRSIFLSMGNAQRKSQNEEMDQPKKQWTRRRVFHDLCDTWLSSHPEKTKDDLAHLMLMPDEKTLRQYYSGSQNPGRERTKQMAKVLGCADSDLLDDSKESHPGIWDTVDIGIRVETESMFHQSKLIPPEKLPEFIEMLKKAHELALIAFKVIAPKK